ncbi:MAG TPA: sulfatase [Prolixibacteraceae bacterium]|nr:sulfatase [Prolixibacteraceae bacterium]
MIYHTLISKLAALKHFVLLIIISAILCSCVEDYEFSYFQSKKVNRSYQTKNVIIVIADGLRYSEGWGDSTHQFMPRMADQLAKEGVVNTRFYNMGGTYTSAGHTSMTTGIYQSINNGGEELPANPSFFQYWNQVYGNDRQKSWIIASKDKLAVLADCNNPFWQGKFTPSVNTGIEGRGLGSGYREDSLTLKTIFEILKQHHPNMLLINFRDPDFSAHSGIWANYVAGIKKTDEYIFRLWMFLQNDSVYKNTTTLFVTSDHGRHLDSVADGFAGHGDGCEGCRHLGFFACGPDFKPGALVNIHREQIDVPVTVAELMGFDLPNTEGNIMTELFRRR